VEAGGLPFIDDGDGAAADGGIQEEGMGKCLGERVAVAIANHVSVQERLNGYAADSPGKDPDARAFAGHRHGVAAVGDPEEWAIYFVTDRKDDQRGVTQL
jgi:hypothetical protein